MAANALSGFWGDIISGVFNFLGSRNAANAATGAAQTQADAAERAAKLLADAQRESLAFQKDQWAQTQSNMKPWLAMGTSAVNTLGNLMGLKAANIPTVNFQGSGQPSGPVAGGTSGPRAGAGGPGGVLTGGVAVPRPGGGGVAVPRPGGSGIPPPSGGGSGRAGSTSLLTRTSPIAGGDAGVAPPVPSNTPTANQPTTMASTYNTNATSVMVTWPDGSTSRVPASQLPRYISLGAQPVNQPSGAMQTGGGAPAMGAMY
jgi:hypothetical protein